MSLLWKTVRITPFSLARAIRRSASALVLTKGFSTTTDPRTRQTSCYSRRGKGGAVTMLPGKKSALDKLLVRVCQDNDELNAVVGKEGLGGAVVLGFGEIDGAMAPSRLLVTVL